MIRPSLCTTPLTAPCRMRRAQRGFLRRHLRGFARDESGNVSIEMVIWLPLILFVLGAAVTLFDANRQHAVTVKAAYTISDALSRQTDPIDDAYLDGMNEVLRFLTGSEGGLAMRVTVVRYDAENDRYQVDWSRSRGSLGDVVSGESALAGNLLSDLSDGTIDMVTDLLDTSEAAVQEVLAAKLPDLVNGERVIVLEVASEHRPIIDLPALQPDGFYQFVFTRPRFAPQLLWEG